MNDNEDWFLGRLKNRRIPLFDRESCIDALEALLSVKALPALVRILARDDEPSALRERAARAISVIGSDYVSSDLDRLDLFESAQVRQLSKAARSV